MKSIKIIPLFLLMFCLCFSACSTVENNDINSLPDTTESQVSIVNSAPQQTQSQPDIIFSNAEDNNDPEIMKNSIGNGNKVEINKVKNKKGKMNGIDVSYWQGKIDWKAVKADGIDFAIIRIGYRGEDGKLYRDSNADYNIQQAQKAEVLVGVYFFSTAVNAKEAKEEATFVINSIKGYKISCPVVYDCEGFLNPDSRMYDLTSEERTANAQSFLKKISANGYEAMFYGAKNELENSRYWDTTILENEYKIWLAYYSSPTYPKIETPDYSGKYDMWQYTNQGQVVGVNGNCDLIVSYKEYKLKSPKDKNVKKEIAEAPKTEEEKIYEDVSDSVTAKEVVNLRSGAGVNYDIVGELKSGDFVKRIGIGKNGWSKLIYKGKTVYAISSYLTKTVVDVPKKDIVNGVEFTPIDDKVTPKMEINLRSLPTTNSDVIAKINSGTFLKRIAISSKGWSRLLYKDKEVYAVTSYLTDKAPEITSKPNNSTENFVEHDMTFKTVKPVNVTAKEETNLREAPTTDSNIIYTLKNGEYVTKNAISDSGWARLEYNGKIVYAVNSFLLGAE